MTKQDSSREKILSVTEMKADYAIQYPQYQPGAQTLKELKTGTGNTELTIVLGTWCTDSRIQMSHFYKILDEAGIDEDWAELIYVDRSKRDEDGLTDDLDIISVPTFIFKVEGKETGRIVERPQLTLEEDILKILKQETPMPASIEPGWLAVLLPEFEKPYMKALKNFLTEEAHAGQTIFPKNSAIFNAFNLTPFDKVEVVILGQDPYHGAGQAHGLSFSVKKGVVTPPSLKNIYKELETDIEGFKTPNHGELTQWAQEGVLLLNATLTVRAGQPGSHQGKGWEAFIDQAITQLSARKTGLVFVLWGKFAQNKAILIDEQKHTVIKSPHPSPFSAYTGFFGSKPFSKTNEALIAKGKKPINWQIS